MPGKDPVYDEPSKVRAVDGHVSLEGPDSVDITMTVEAAEETSERLFDESVKASGQRRLKRHPHRPQER
jgi:hypothetical protein